MSLIVNGIIIDDSLIASEVERLRPDYQAVFKDQTPEEQEAQLKDWARENVIERILIQQAANNDPGEISPQQIDEAFKKIKAEHGGDEIFYKNSGLTKADDHQIKSNLELQLRVERLIHELTQDIPRPTEQQARKYYQENLNEFRINKQVKTAHIVESKKYDQKLGKPLAFDDVKEKIISQLLEESRNKKVEEFIDEIKAKADIRESIQRNSQAQKIQKQLNSVLIKPAGPDCNMACTYCFYLEKANLFSETKAHRMSEQILEEMVRQVMTQGGSNVSFGWQGGEPTLMGLPFYRKAVEFQQRYGHGQTVGNGLQTNGILIDAEWAKFLAEYNFLVGLSLDGPEHIHNHYRFMQGGKGSWSRVMDSAKLMLDTDVAVNALIVVNDYSVNFPDEIYNFHKELGLIYQQYIPCVETDIHNPNQAASFSVSAEKYGDFLCTLFDLWLADFKNSKPTTSIRYFDSLFYNYVGAPPPECTLLPECGIYVVVEHNGDIYSCDFFVEPQWKLGNIMTGNIREMLNSDRQHQFGQLKATLPDHCQQCKWLRYCWGGCTKDRLRDPRDNNLNHFCQSYKIFYEHADQQLQQLAVSWKQEQVRLSRQEALLESIKKGEIKVSRNDPCPCGSGKKFKKCCGLNF